MHGILQRACGHKNSTWQTEAGYEHNVGKHAVDRPECFREDDQTQVERDLASLWRGLNTNIMSTVGCRGVQPHFSLGIMFSIAQ